MAQSVACDQLAEWKINGVAHRRIPYGDERRYGDNHGGDGSGLSLREHWATQGISVATKECHDCGTPSDGLHHPGCDMEECPRCRQQAIGCRCNWADDA